VEAAGAARRKVLITIFQRGAVDGLNMVVPFGEKDYYAARPSIAVPKPNAADGAVDLDGFFGLHPRLAPLKPLWDSRQLAIVHASGSPDGTRSHFDAQDYMESGTPGVKSTQDGWLNRYLHAREHASATPFRAVALAPQLPRMLQGTGARARHEPDRAVRHPRRPGDRHGAGVVRIGIRRGGGRRPPSHRRPGVRRRPHAQIRPDPSKYQPENGAEYPRSGYGQALRQIAQLVKADVGLEVAFAEAGGWDTHVNQGASVGQLAQRLGDFGQGIAALARDLGDRMEGRRHPDDERIRPRRSPRTETAEPIMATATRCSSSGGRASGAGSLRQVAGPRARAAVRRPRSRRDDGLPERVQRGDRVHLGLADTRTIFPGFTNGQTLGFIG
jgi:hypothetical protein